jgi:cyclopropane-fatty-acyl-phospholipid synthase
VKEDYRKLAGEYDRLAAIEMIEAVGDRHLPAFFEACCRRLKPDGLALIQAITVPDREYAWYVKRTRFHQPVHLPRRLLRRRWGR